MSENDNKDDVEFFNGLKTALLKLCESNSDIIEFQRFKKQLSNLFSFDELAKYAKIDRK